jgi:DNA modification methylase
MEYQDFLTSKIVKIKEQGFEVKATDIHPMLFDWQNEIVRWACRIGKIALFEECGLGKTLQQIEWARLVVGHLKSINAPCQQALIVAPLAVAHQTIREGEKVGVKIVYIRHQEEAALFPDCDIFICNYDMLKEFDGGAWGAVVLDESSILKSYTGATKRMILDMFESVPYKMACTATPAPNDHLELGNHAQFLDTMQSNEMIQRWFINDSMHAGNYRLKHHAEKDFWKWVTSWAVCISKPSDMGYDNDGFNIPELIMHDIAVGVDHTRAFANGELILAGAQSATEMWREKKATLVDRCAKAEEIIKARLNETWIIWCDTNSEADLLMKLFPQAVEVRGDQSISEKERKLMSFSVGEVKMIITKADIAGFGLNWQHCHNQVFVGVTYSFEKTYQALRRSWRFGQKQAVNAYMIYAETEGNIMKTLSDKQEMHKTMQRAMNEAMQENGLGVMDSRAAKVDIITGIKEGDNWKMLLGDACQEIAKIPDNSIDFSVYSPPFSNLYIYSDYVADMGNSADDEEFFQHYLYLIKDIYRVLKPGRLVAVHCKDLPLYMNRDGAAGLSDFPGRIVRAHEEAGFTYHSRVTIWKDPVIEMQRTKNHGLLHKNWTERSEVVRQGMPDYIVVFRKFLGLEDVPDKQVVHHLVAKDHEYRGDNPPTDYDSDRDYSIQVWQRYASPVWFDINQTRVLNAQLGREGNDEKHICPLQLDVIDRCIDIWTNPLDVVLSPFAGIGSEGVEAVKMGRRFIGIELKESYFKIAVKNLTEAEEYKNMPKLFDF